MSAASDLGRRADAAAQRALHQRAPAARRCARRRSAACRPGAASASSSPGARAQAVGAVGEARPRVVVPRREDGARRSSASSGRSAATRASHGAGAGGDAEPLERARRAGEAVEHRAPPRRRRPVAVQHQKRSGTLITALVGGGGGERDVQLRGVAELDAVERLALPRPGARRRAQRRTRERDGDDHVLGLEVAGRPSARRRPRPRATGVPSRTRVAEPPRPCASARPWLPPAIRWLGSGAKAATCSSTLVCEPLRALRAGDLDAGEHGLGDARLQPEAADERRRPSAPAARRGRAGELRARGLQIAAASASTPRGSRT